MLLKAVSFSFADGYEKSFMAYTVCGFVVMVL
jgi:hypothetical protein